MNVTELREHICETYPDLCPLFSLEFGDGVLTVDPERLRQAAVDLHNFGFDLLGMVTAVDRGDAFELVYRLRSRVLSVGMFLKCRIPRDEPKAPSMVDLWPAADWHEREVYDLFGVVFEGHPNLRRMFLPEDWKGHPLRKDYVDDNIIRRPDYF